LRVILFTGKGGVGKTTVAAATAVHAARSGVKTLVLSTDAAHSLGDALDVALPVDEAVEVEAGLWAQQVDAAGRLRGVWGQVQSYLLDLLTAVDVEPVDAAELTVLPGADDVLTLLALRDQVERGPWDLVVVDCAPTAETLRLLALPEAVTRLVDRLLPAQRVLSRALVPAVGRAAGLPAPAREVVSALTRLRSQLQEALDVVRAPTTSVRLVLTPEAVVLAEARRTLTALSLQGLVVDAVVANRVIPAGGGSSWQDGWVQAQSVVLAEAEVSFDPLPVALVPYLDREPVGTVELAAVGRELLAGEGVEAMLRAPQRPEPMRVEHVDDDLQLVLELPLARASDVDLARRGDDLLLTVGGRHRVVSLPSVLRRCEVVGARVEGQALHVRFRRDRDLWPAS
jgi:arsenite-transporting ATPase